MPASRRARAMIFAPRSCPSKPGFAITTRIFRATTVSLEAVRRRVSRLEGLAAVERRGGLEDGCLAPNAPDLPQGVTHLAHGHIRLRGLDDRRHQVSVFARCVSF